ncbi:MAG: hypothetical protein ACYDB0_11650 [Acidithiobacillus sp.]
MDNSAAITFWSADAFLTLSGTNSYKTLTPELISRISAFVDAYILFDKVRLPERYQRYQELNELGGTEVFAFTPSDDLIHSDDLSKGITFDIGIAAKAFPEIIEKEKYWTLQHNPEFGSVYSTAPDLVDGNIMSLMRLWQWCAMNELTEKYASTPLLPNSIVGIEELETKGHRESPYAYNLFSQFVERYQSKIVSISGYVKDPYIDTIKSYPPLLAILLHRSHRREQLSETLKSMREDYKEIRKLQQRFVSSVADAASVGEKKQIIESWNSEWKKLLEDDCKSVGFLSRSVSSGDIANLAYSFINHIEIMKLLTTKGASIVADYISQRKEVKLTKQFKVFCRISKDADSVYFNNDALYKKFGIEGIVGC